MDNLQTLNLGLDLFCPDANVAINDFSAYGPRSFGVATRIASSLVPNYVSDLLQYPDLDGRDVNEAWGGAMWVGILIGIGAMVWLVAMCWCMVTCCSSCYAKKTCNTCRTPDDEMAIPMSKVDQEARCQTMFCTILLTISSALLVLFLIIYGMLFAGSIQRAACQSFRVSTVGLYGAVEGDQSWPGTVRLPSLMTTIMDMFAPVEEPDNITGNLGQWENATYAAIQPYDDDFRENMDFLDKRTAFTWTAQNTDFDWETCTTNRQYRVPGHHISSSVYGLTTNVSLRDDVLVPWEDAMLQLNTDVSGAVDDALAATESVYDDMESVYPDIVDIVDGREDDIVPILDEFIEQKNNFDTGLMAYRLFFMFFIILGFITPLCCIIPLYLMLARPSRYSYTAPEPNLKKMRSMACCACTTVAISGFIALLLSFFIVTVGSVASVPCVFVLEDLFRDNMYIHYPYIKHQVGNDELLEAFSAHCLNYDGSGQFYAAIAADEDVEQSLASLENVSLQMSQNKAEATEPLQGGRIASIQGLVNDTYIWTTTTRGTADPWGPLDEQLALLGDTIIPPYMMDPSIVIRDSSDVCQRHPATCNLLDARYGETVYSLGTMENTLHSLEALTDEIAADPNSVLTGGKWCYRGSSPLPNTCNYYVEMCNIYDGTNGLDMPADVKLWYDEAVNLGLTETAHQFELQSYWAMSKARVAVSTLFYRDASDNQENYRQFYDGIRRELDLCVTAMYEVDANMDYSIAQLDHDIAELSDWVDRKEDELNCMIMFDAIAESSQVMCWDVLGDMLAVGGLLLGIAIIYSCWWCMTFRVHKYLNQRVKIEEAEKELFGNPECLKIACMDGNVETVKRCLRYQDGSQPIEDGNTPLHYVGGSGDTQGYVDCVVELLSAAGVQAAIEAPNTNNLTPLMTAACCSNYQVCNVLLAHGADVNTVDMDGDTPYHRAVLDEDAEGMTIIESYNPNTSIRNNDGKTANDLKGDRADAVESSDDGSGFMDTESHAAENDASLVQGEGVEEEVTSEEEEDAPEDSEGESQEEV